MDQNVVDSDLIALMICNIMDINGEELLPEIEKLFDRRLVSTSNCGTWTDVKDSINQPRTFNIKKDILSIFDRYKNISSTWAG